MYEKLKNILSNTFTFVEKVYKGQQIGIDCNTEYGEIRICINSKVNLPIDEEESYYFGDWVIPDISNVHQELANLWEKEWSSFQDIIRDDWLDLPSFDEIFNRKCLIETICITVTQLTKNRVLIADHDEVFELTFKRMQWANKAIIDDKHELLTNCKWNLKDGDNLNQLAFFNDGEFINFYTLANSDVIESRGKWNISENQLTMEYTDINVDDSDLLDEVFKFSLDSLSKKKLTYSTSDESWTFFVNDE